LRTADHSGWMSKKGSSAVGPWKTRFFTLNHTRLSYFGSMKDTKEKGLIDITAHKVLPARDDDKFVALYAATTGQGRYCFKLVPPAPGYKKGLTFTQPKVHYFAVDTKEEMRGWMAALMKATIDLDESIPIVSSCVTPTVTLQKAQELLAKA
ncbi:Boi family PH domain-containing protein, partial [Ascoidea rubescens DSM 1968]